MNMDGFRVVATVSKWPLVMAMAARMVLAQSVGEALLPWTPGTLDIHQISTGRGNSAFFILPDGTTLLVDAGAAGDGLPETDPHPDASRSPGAWIARYVRRRLPAGVDALDYALITHFHADHFGQVVGSSPLDRIGSYRLTGITEVDQTVPIRVLLDRGWPDYAYPSPLTDSTITNYRKFVEARAKSGMIVERFTPGSNSQVRLLHDPQRYAGFEVRNIIANGEVWTGSGGETRRLFPPLETLAPADRPNENMCSLGFRLHYGRFRYFTGGDLPGAADPGFPAWHAVEPVIASIVGPVDVQVVNQHGSMGVESEPFLAALRSTVLIIPSWAPSHPAPDVLKRIVNSRLPPSPRYVFVTDLRDATRIVIGQRAAQLPPSGHIVVRVEPGGARYRVFVLDHHNESDRILSANGPFESN
jgi:beta-lactamase superfamily II metal-dependent hydrolase